MTTPGRERVALVTGTAMGIGAATAATLAARCATIISLDVAGADTSDTRQACEAAGAAFVAVEADVSDEAAVREAFGVVDGAGRLDIVVNCAGIAPGEGWLIETSTIEDWRRVLDVNLTGTYLVCREAIPHLRRNGWGRVITIASQTARQAMPFVAAHYVASKAAIPAFTRMVAWELASQGVTANCVAPGLTNTRMADPFDHDAYGKGVPLGRIGEPVDVANAIAFLTSDEAAYITGVTLDVNGGAFMP